jgi:hypothetical protein
VPDGNFGKMWVDGLKLFVIGLIYSIPIWLIGLVAGAPVALVGMTSDNPDVWARQWAQRPAWATC